MKKEIHVSFLCPVHWMGLSRRAKSCLAEENLFLYCTIARLAQCEEKNCFVFVTLAATTTGNICASNSQIYSISTSSSRSNSFGDLSNEEANISTVKDKQSI
jgi:hypothetical protein